MFSVTATAGNMNCKKFVSFFAEQIQCVYTTALLDQWIL